MTEAVVIKAYRSAYPDPLILKKGVTVKVEVRQTDWEGWLWTTTEKGNQGWVPERFVERDGGRGVLKRDYNATELTVSEGERLRVLDRESGWALCQKLSGGEGWVPEENLRPE